LFLDQVIPRPGKRRTPGFLGNRTELTTSSALCQLVTDRSEDSRDVWPSHHPEGRIGSERGPQPADL
jgi:hypothetical protein